MIFVTIGTHPQGFNRLLRHIDLLAKELKEEVIIQRGFSSYVPRNTKSFTFADDLKPYYAKARLVISHSATSVLEYMLTQKRPIITVPRQKKYGEHINDHQVEFALFLAKKTGIPAILSLSDLTLDMLKNYHKKPVVDRRNLVKLQHYFKNLFDQPL